MVAVIRQLQVDTVAFDKGLAEGYVQLLLLAKGYHLPNVLWQESAVGTYVGLLQLHVAETTMSDHDRIRE